MSWLNWRDTASLETGPFNVRRVSGDADPPTLLNAVPVPAALVARACSGCGRLKAPLTRWPVARVLASCTVSVAFPAVEITFAVGAGRIRLREARGERAEARRRSQGKCERRGHRSRRPTSSLLRGASFMRSPCPAAGTQLAVSEEGPLPAARRQRQGAETVGGGQRERQCLRVCAGPQRVGRRRRAGSNWSVTGSVGDRRAICEERSAARRSLNVAERRTGARGAARARLQRRRQAEGAVDQVARSEGARIVHGERRIPGGGGHQCGGAAQIVLRDAGEERAEVRRRSEG